MKREESKLTRACVRSKWRVWLWVLSSTQVREGKGSGSVTGRRDQVSPREGRLEKPTIGLALVVGPAVVHERVVDISRLERLEQVEEELGILQTRILEAAHRRLLPALLDLIVRPFDDIRVGHLATVLAQRRHRAQDVAPHHLPHEAEGQGPRPVDNVGTLDPDNVHVVLLGEVEAVVGVLDRLEPRERERRLRHSSPRDRAGDHLVERLQQYEAVLRVAK